MVEIKKSSPSQEYSDWNEKLISATVSLWPLSVTSDGTAVYRVSRLPTMLMSTW